MTNEPDFARIKELLDRLNTPRSDEENNKIVTRCITDLKNSIMLDMYNDFFDILTQP